MDAWPRRWRAVARMARAVAVAAALAGASAAAGQERATPQDAEALVRRAVAYLKQHGREKAFAAFDSPTGGFTKGDLYVVVYDLRGKCLAHGALPGRIGRDLLDDKDADGKAFVRERIRIANTRGGGWQEYKFLNPATGRTERKQAFIQPYQDLVVVAGAYSP